MKTKAILTLFLLCIVCTGCKKPTECTTSYWPDPETTISWDECNDVMTTKNYFDCHDSVLLNNSYKTIEVCGYIKKYVNTSIDLTALAICSDSIMTPDNYILLGYMDGAPIPTYDSACMSKLTGVINIQHGFDECCNKLYLGIKKIEKL